MDGSRDTLVDIEDAERPQWFERTTLTPVRMPELLPDGTLGDRVWRARGWSTED